MENLINQEPGIIFSPGEIEKQLKRIFLDPHFIGSEILKKFLSFIVHEAFQGHSNRLKEYTIAINVLEKPANFKPWENGIVRIHAGRLRRALSQYYRGKGNEDPIVITIPKGHYIPSFSDHENILPENGIDKNTGNSDIISHDEQDITLAILPFICSGNRGLAMAFAKGLCLQLGTMLMQFDQISVIACQVLKNSSEGVDYKQLASSVGFNHILTGGVQCSRDKIRVFIQLIESHSCKQIWSEMYEHKLTKSNLFAVEDEICRIVSGKVVELSSTGRRERHSLPMLSAI